MKTLMLFREDCDPSEPAKFLLLDGDHRRLNQVFINGCAPNDTQNDTYDKLCDELSDLIYDENYGVKAHFTSEPAKDWDYFITCGFLP